jgi:hypothetical protein
MGEQAYWLVTARDGVLHELPEGTGQTRCGQWKELEVNPPTAESRFCPACRKASQATTVQGSLDLGQ